METLVAPTGPGPRLRRNPRAPGARTRVHAGLTHRPHAAQCDFTPTRTTMRTMMMTNNIKITSIFRFFFWYCSAYRERREKRPSFSPKSQIAISLTSSPRPLAAPTHPTPLPPAPSPRSLPSAPAGSIHASPKTPELPIYPASLTPALGTRHHTEAAGEAEGSAFRSLWAASPYFSFHWPQGPTLSTEASRFRTQFSGWTHSSFTKKSNTWLKLPQPAGMEPRVPKKLVFYLLWIWEQEEIQPLK